MEHLFKVQAGDARCCSSWRHMPYSCTNCNRALGRPCCLLLGKPCSLPWMPIATTRCCSPQPSSGLRVSPHADGSPLPAYAWRTWRASTVGPAVAHGCSKMSDDLHHASAGVVSNGIAAADAEQTFIRASSPPHQRPPHPFPRVGVVLHRALLLRPPPLLPLVAAAPCCAPSSPRLLRSH